MKKFFLLCVALCCGLTYSFAQAKVDHPFDPMTARNTPEKRTMYIYEVQDKATPLMTYSESGFESVDGKLIESLSVLKGESATTLYGDKGKDGVIIVRFEQFDKLSKELQDKFTEPKG